MLSRVEEIYSKGLEAGAEISFSPSRPRFSGEFLEGEPAEYLWTKTLTSCIAIGFIYQPYKKIKKFELYHSNAEHSSFDRSSKLSQAINHFLEGIEDTHNVRIVLGYNSDHYFYFDEDIRKGKADFDVQQSLVYELMEAHCLKLGKKCIPFENYELFDGDDTFFLTREGKIGSLRKACHHSIKIIEELLETELDNLENFTAILEILKLSNGEDEAEKTLEKIKQLAYDMLQSASLKLTQIEQLFCIQILSWDYVTNSPLRYLAEKKLYDILDVIRLFKEQNPSHSMVIVNKIYQLIDSNLQSHRLHLLDFQLIEKQIRELCKEEVKAKFNFFKRRIFKVETSDIVAEILDILTGEEELRPWIVDDHENLNLRHSC